MILQSLFPVFALIAMGVLLKRFKLSFPVFLNNTFQLASLVTLPLALLSIGGALTLRSVKGNPKLSLAAAFFKLLLLPAFGLFFLKLLSVPEQSAMAGMIFFSLPPSTAIYILSSQLGSHTQTASAALVVSTVLSFGVLAAVLLLPL